MMTISYFCYLAWLSSAVRMIPLYPCNRPGTLYVIRKYWLHVYITPSTISVSKFISSIILTVSQVISVLLFCGQLFKHWSMSKNQTKSAQTDKVHWTKVKPNTLVMYRVQELCESRGDCPGLPVPNKPYGFCGRKATFWKKKVQVRNYVGELVEEEDRVSGAEQELKKNF